MPVVGGGAGFSPRIHRGHPCGDIPASDRSGGPAYGEVVGVATVGPMRGSPSARDRSEAVVAGLLTIFTPLEKNMQPKKGVVTRRIGPAR